MSLVELTIEYDGSDFNGWQVQPKGQRTVQGELQKTLKVLFKRTIKVTGSGRTDSGVHAAGQVAHATIPDHIPIEKLPQALNANLPKDIVILAAVWAKSEFHAQYSTKRKTYRYCVINRPFRTALERRFSWHVPEKLNLAAIKRESSKLLGKNDFRAFTAADPAKRRAGKDQDTVRTLYRCDVKREKGHIIFELEANGFLYKMVRNIVGTLIDVGTGRLPKGSCQAILTGRDRSQAGMTAPPQGLCLVRVDYS